MLLLWFHGPATPLTEDVLVSDSGSPLAYSSDSFQLDHTLLSIEFFGFVAPDNYSMRQTLNRHASGGISTVHLVCVFM